MDDRYTRASLYKFFEDGARPTGKQFRQLVDSMLNMVDEGFSKTPQEGLRVASAVTHNALLSFYRENQQQRLWSLGFSEEADRLQFSNDQAAVPTLTLDVRRDDEQDRTWSRVGINTDKPRHELQVEGVVCMHGRTGGLPLVGKPPVADGKWYSLTEELTGCHAFEVMAGAGRPGSGSFALTHAVAMNAFNPMPSWSDLFGSSKSIREQHAWYGKRCDRLQLRWEGDNGRDGKYRLQIRSRCDYGGATPIQVNLTRLWFDPMTADPAATKKGAAR